MPEMTLSELGELYSGAANNLPKDIEKYLKRHAAVGSGAMKRAIQARDAVDMSDMLNSTTFTPNSSGDGYLIGPRVGYSLYVALGTYKMKARPFHEDTEKVIKNNLEKHPFDLFTPVNVDMGKHTPTEEYKGERWKRKGGNNRD